MKSTISGRPWQVHLTPETEEDWVVIKSLIKESNEIRSKR